MTPKEPKKSKKKDYKEFIRILISEEKHWRPSAQVRFADPRDVAMWKALSLIASYYKYFKSEEL